MQRPGFTVDPVHRSRDAVPERTRRMSDGLFSFLTSSILAVHPVQLFSVVGASRRPSKFEEEQQQQARPNEEHTQICGRGCCIRRSGHSASGRWGTSSAAQLHYSMGLYHGPRDCSSRCGTPSNVHTAKTRHMHTVVPAQSAVAACVPTGGQHQSVRRQLVQLKVERIESLEELNAAPEPKRIST